MRILQIAPQVPLPLDAGGRIGIYNITKYVSQLGHEIDLLMYTKSQVSDEQYQELAAFCNPHFVIADTSDSAAGAIKNLFSPVPYNISKYIQPEMLRAVRKLIRRNNYDIVHIDHLHLAWLSREIKALRNCKVVLREHNLEMEIMQRFYETQKNPFVKAFAWMQYKKLKSYEPRLCSQVDTAIMITSVDRDKLLNLKSNIHTTVIPAGVTEDLLNFPLKQSQPWSLFHVGSLEWLPNLNGLQWFIDNVMPLLVEKYPQTKLFIYGKATDKLLIPNKYKDNIAVIGYVDNLWTEIEDKGICIVPLFVGGGIRIKVLEMMALGKIIVTTAVGKEGIEAFDVEHLLIAEDAGRFGEKVRWVFNNPGKKDAIKNSAKELISLNYTWESIAKKFEEVYKTS